MTTTEATPRLLAAGRRLEIAGQKFSRLTAIGRQPGGKTLWKFRCDCGSEVIKNASYVKNGNITIDGVAKTVRDWEIHAGVKRGVFQRRIDIGWSHEKAITIPVMPGVPLRSRE